MTNSSSQMTPARRLFVSTLAHLNDEIALTERTGDDKKPWRTLMSQAPIHEGSCGDVRLFVGAGLYKIVTCSITVPAIGLDSHMLFAFTPSQCGVPHFTLDSVQSGDQLAFHLDLIPRLDLATNLDYMDWAFSGISDAFAAAANIDGLSRAHITPRQRAVMSPWMLAHRATPTAFHSVAPMVQRYLDHWLGLVREGAPREALNGATPIDLITRDRANKSVIFDPSVDKVWDQIRSLIGSQSVDAIREQLLEIST